jgi:hypothetical protein
VQGDYLNEQTLFTRCISFVRVFILVTFLSFKKGEEHDIKTGRAGGEKSVFLLRRLQMKKDYGTYYGGNDEGIGDGNDDCNDRIA